MKTNLYKLVFALTILLILPKWCHALDFTASYDVYMVPNVSNNYDDGRGFTLGVNHPIWKDLSGRVEAVHISDIDFPCKEDPKGSWGELRGYGAFWNVFYTLKYDERLSFVLYGGAGPVWWQFRENPALQDAGVTVRTDPSLVLKTGILIDYKIREGWKIELGAGWMDTNIHKVATDDSGTVWNILDADETIGWQAVTYKVGIVKKF